MDRNYQERSGQAAGSELVGLGRWSALVCGGGGLDQLVGGEFRFFAVPAKVSGLGTFPVRAFAVVS